MNAAKNNRVKWIHIRLTQAEYDLIEKNFRITTCRKLSEYTRHLLFQKPVTVFTRDRSKDECLDALIQLKKELNAVGVNLNQAVKRLHTLDTLSQANQWVISQENIHKAIISGIDEIKNYMQQIAGKW